jgi:hypothetical protein
MQEDLDIASGAKAFDLAQAKIYYKNLKAASENIQAAFKKQMENTMVCLRVGFRTVTYISLLTGTMGSRQIQAAACRMDCGM